MKRAFTSIVLAAVAAAFAPATASAGLERVQGSFAGASLSVVDPDGCRQSSVSFVAVNERSHSQPGPSQAAARLDVHHQSYDACTGEVLFEGGGTFDIAPDAFTVSSRDGSARLDATVELADAHSARTATFTFHLAWQALASPWLESRTRFHLRDAGGFVLVLDALELSTAVVLGSVSDGTTEYADGEVAWAEVGESRAGVLVKPAAMGTQAAATQTSATAAPSSAWYESTWAVAIWEAFDETGCIRRLGVVSAERASIDRADPVTFARLEFSRWNHCTNEPEFFVETDFVPLAEGAFALEPSFDGARLTGDVAGTDRVSGAPVTLAVDVMWNGIGPIARAGTSHSSTENGVSRTTFDASRSRGADVDGSVAGPAGNLVGGYPVGGPDLIGAAFGQIRNVTRTRG